MTVSWRRSAEGTCGRGSAALDSRSAFEFPQWLQNRFPALLAWLQILHDHSFGRPQFAQNRLAAAISCLQRKQTTIHPHPTDRVWCAPHIVRQAKL